MTPRLLLDQNISFRLKKRLADIFPECKHVGDFGLSKADDSAIWLFARDNKFIILTKDSDYQQLSLELGFPPKVILLRLFNGSTDKIEETKRIRASEISAFDDKSTEAILTFS